MCQVYKWEHFYGQNNPFYGKEHTEETKQIISNYNRNNSTVTRAILQYTMDGKFIREFVSAAEADRCTDIDSSSIAKSLNQKQIGAGGFVWKYRDEYEAIPLQIEVRVRRPDVNMKKIDQCNMDGTIIKTWNSMIEAHNSGFHKVKVSNCCRGIKPQYKGFLWKYHLNT